MLKSYPAIFHKEGTGYWIEFPEFGGGTEGATIELAMKNAREMLESVLASYIDEGLALPTPSDISKLKAPDGFVTLIQVNPLPFVKNNKAIRKNVPEWLVRLADREKVNYSEVLTQALESRLQL